MGNAKKHINALSRCVMKYSHVASCVSALQMSGGRNSMSDIELLRVSEVAARLKCAVSAGRLVRVRTEDVEDFLKPVPPGRGRREK